MSRADIPQVIYASINETTTPERQDADGNIVSSKKSITISKPIGTIRLVPFPHPPHPEPGSSYHDGKEPYIKLGRLAVAKEFRGSGLARMLVSASMTWAQQNPTYFNPSVKSMGMEKIGALLLDEIPVWKGLICVHAQEQVAKTWAKWGYKVDEGMGTWVEEGINHVGMFQRLNIEKQEA